MIEARLAITDDEIAIVRKAMPLFGTSTGVCIYGYWDDGKCIGGSYLQKQFPHELVMEFYCHCPTVIKAIANSFSGMLKIYPQLNAKIEITNKKSLKIAKMLGFVKLYIADNKVAFQFNRKNSRYNKRCPLD